MGNDSRHKVDYAFADTLIAHGGQVTCDMSKMTYGQIPPESNRHTYIHYWKHK
jgi:hypothetical protein